MLYLINTLPIDVINHIIGYTYNPIKKEIAEDIKHYVKTKKYAYCSSTEFTPCTLYYHLKIWKRYIGYKNKENYLKIYNKKFLNLLSNHCIYFEWGLMTIDERNETIKLYTENIDVNESIGYYYLMLV
jgi:hypothetical protein